MKNTALTQKHIDLGAKMVPFAGYNMPVQYEGVNAEHDTVRNCVGVFDVSHMGEFLLKGPNALALIQKVCTNDAAVLFDGKAQYSCMPNGKGGIVDDLIIYRIDAETYFIVVNASNIDKDWHWISSHNDLGVEMQNLSDAYSLLAIQGPKAAEAMQSLTSIDLSNMTYYTFQYGNFAGIENVMVSATGYTGSGGFEVYVKNEDAEKLWDAVFSAGANWGIKPIGLAARDTLRLEMGFCLYGNDIDASTTPVEANLNWAMQKVRRTGGARAGGFPGADKVLAQLGGTQPAQRLRVGLVALERVPVREHVELHNADGQKIGEVTSGLLAPTADKPIALAYVETQYAQIGTRLNAMVRGKAVPMEVSPLPFVPNRYYRG